MFFTTRTQLKNLLWFCVNWFDMLQSHENENSLLANCYITLQIIITTLVS